MVSHQHLARLRPACDQAFEFVLAILFVVFYGVCFFLAHLFSFLYMVRLRSFKCLYSQVWNMSSVFGFPRKIQMKVKNGEFPKNLILLILFWRKFPRMFYKKKANSRNYSRMTYVLDNTQNFRVNNQVLFYYYKKIFYLKLFYFIKAIQLCYFPWAKVSFAWKCKCM